MTEKIFFLNKKNQMGGNQSTKQKQIQLINNMEGKRSNIPSRMIKAYGDIEQGLQEIKESLQSEQDMQRLPFLVQQIHKQLRPLKDPKSIELKHHIIDILDQLDQLSKKQSLERTQDHVNLMVEQVTDHLQQQDRQSLKTALEQVQAELSLFEKEKEQHQELRIQHIKNQLKPIIQELKHKHQEKRIQEVGLALKPVLDSIKQLGKKPSKQAQSKRMHTILNQLTQTIETVNSVKDALKKEESCEHWKTDKSHNPFNKTKRGRRLNPVKKTYRLIEDRCLDKSNFCDRHARSKTIVQKYC